MLIELKALRAGTPGPARPGHPSSSASCWPPWAFRWMRVDAGNGTVVLEVDVTANRGDVLSHRGLARDIAARLDADLAPLAAQRPEGRRSPCCPCAWRARPAPSTRRPSSIWGRPRARPPEVQAFLGHMGSNAKNLPPVDASNEILHRVGHPTHAFDADTIQGALIVRWARQGEKVVTLDGVERTLTAQDLVIADEAGAIALAGVMGGDSTKVTASHPARAPGERLLRSADRARHGPPPQPPHGRLLPLRPGRGSRHGPGGPGPAGPAPGGLGRAPRLVGAWTAGAVPAAGQAHAASASSSWSAWPGSPSSWPRPRTS